LGESQHKQPRMGVIKLNWSGADVDIAVECGDDIATCDLLEVIEVFIRVMDRSPVGELEFIDGAWSLPEGESH
jgi:hypothetical protein